VLLQKLVWLSGDFIIVVVILVLLRRSLAVQYRAWWGFLVVQLSRELVLALVPPQKLRYAHIFMVSEILIDVLLVISVYEWFRLLWVHYPGIRLAGTWFLNAALGLSLLISLATVGPDWKTIDWNAPQFGVVLFINHVTVGVLGAFVVLVLLGFLTYRVRVRPNVIWHGLLLTAYLLLQNGLAIADARSGLHSIARTNSFRAIAVPLLYLGWALFLTEHGEEVEIAARLTPDESYQLDRLNDELLALVRRTTRGI
jgi:hypothetical protein